MATAPGTDNTTAPRTLLAHHREQLRGSGLTDATIDAAGIHSVIDKAKAAELLHWEGSEGPAPALAFPVFGFDGKIVQTILRPDTPRVREDGSAPKYEVPSGERHRIGFPPPTLVPHEQLLDPTKPLILTEGAKKGLSAIQAGVIALAASGVSVWHDAEHRRSHRGKPNEWSLHPDLAPIPVSGRTVYVGFDGGDTTGNTSVIIAEARLARLLLDAGAIVFLLRIPFQPCGPKVGLDDYLMGVAK